MAIKGTVKWFNNARGFGFIGRVGERDVFVHYSAINKHGFKTISEGDEVEFEVEQAPKGPQARNVTRIKTPAKAASIGGSAA